MVGRAPVRSWDSSDRTPAVRYICESLVGAHRRGAKTLEFGAFLGGSDARDFT